MFNSHRAALAALAIPALVLSTAPAAAGQTLTGSLSSASVQTLTTGPMGSVTGSLFSQEQQLKAQFDRLLRGAGLTVDSALSRDAAKCVAEHIKAINDESAPVWTCDYQTSVAIVVAGPLKDFEEALRDGEVDEDTLPDDKRVGTAITVVDNLVVIGLATSK